MTLLKTEYCLKIQYEDEVLNYSMKFTITIDFNIDNDKNINFYQNLLKDIAWSVANDLPDKHEENLPLS